MVNLFLFLVSVLPVFLRIITAKPLLQIYREKAEQRRTATLKQGNKLPIDNILPNGESEGKAIEQFAEVVHSNPETVRQALYIEEHATPKRIETVKKGLFLQVYIFFCETIETLRESKDTFTIH